MLMCFFQLSDSEEEPESDPVSAAPKSAKLVGSTFFGPDFNLDAFRGDKNKHLCPVFS